MPEALVSRLGQRNELAEFKAVLHDAGDRAMRSVDAESMARELLASGSREVVEMVRDLTTALARAERELESANRRYEQLTADLARRGISLAEAPPTLQETGGTDGGATAKRPDHGAERPEDAAAEWAEWDRRFQSLLA